MKGSASAFSCSWGALIVDLSLEILSSLNSLQKKMAEPESVWLCEHSCFPYQGVHELIICNSSHCMSGYALYRLKEHFQTCGDQWAFRTFIYFPEANREGQVGPGSGLHPWLQLPTTNGDQRPSSRRTWRAWADHSWRESSSVSHKQRRRPIRSRTSLCLCSVSVLLINGKFP